jgi:hypothetical protein
VKLKPKTYLTPPTSAGPDISSASAADRYEYGKFLSPMFFHTLNIPSNSSALGMVPAWLLPPMAMAYELVRMGKVPHEWSILIPAGGVR